MSSYNIGIYTCHRIMTTDGSRRRINVLPKSRLNLGDVENCDQMLHQSLKKIYSKRRFRSSRSQIKKFRRDGQCNDYRKSITKTILDQVLVLFSKHFSKEKLEQLPLLWIVVLAGYKKSAELLIRHGADVNEPFGRRDPQVVDEKWTVLYVLLQMSPENEQLIRLITDHGADLQIQDEHGDTPLHYAVWKGQVEMTKILLEKGADINVANEDGETPLLTALSHAKRMPTIKKVLPLFIKYGPDMNARDYEKRTALHYAVREANVELTEAFIKMRANVNTEDRINMTPLLEALRVKGPRCDKLVKLLMEHGADVKAKDYRGRTVVTYAVRGGRIQMTERFINMGLDVNAVDSITGMTPLLEAIAKGVSATRGSIANEMVRMLVRHRANVLVKDCKVRNALHYLVNIPEEQAVALGKFLIKKGVSLDDYDKQHELPIHKAVASGRDKLVKLFLDHGANVDALTGKGEYPLHIAVQSGEESVVETLLKYGANVDLKTNEGLTPLNFACRHAADLRRQLEDYNGSNVIRLLLSAGADVLDEYDEKTPLATLMLSRMEADVTGLWEEFLPLIEVLALKKSLQPSIKLKDEMIIERDKNLQNYYRQCFKEIDRMKSTRFIEFCTVFQLITKSQRQIAAFIRNSDFEIHFRLLDLNNFPLYDIAIREAFERGKKYYYAKLEQEDLINEAVYGILPYLVVEKVVDYVLN